MSLLTIILIVLLLAVVFGGVGFDGGSYRNHGFGLGFVLLIIIIVLLLNGRL